MNKADSDQFSTSQYESGCAFIAPERPSRTRLDTIEPKLCKMEFVH